MELRVVKDRLLGELQDLPTPRFNDFKVALRFVPTFDEGTNEQFRISVMEYECLYNKIDDAKRFPRALSEIVEELFAVSQRNRLYFKERALRGA